MEKKCLNCGHIVENAFCSYCGQAVNTGIIDWKYCGKEILNGFFKKNDQFIHTFSKLIIQPQQLIVDYLSGKRVLYLSSIRFIFLVFFFSGIIYVCFKSGDSSSVMQVKIEGVTVHFDFRKYIKSMTVLIVFFSAIGSYVIFRKNRYTLPEHFFINLYITGASLAMTSLIKLVTLNQFPTLYSITNVVLLWQFYLRIFALKNHRFRNVVNASFCLILNIAIVFIIIFTIIFFKYLTA